MTIVTKRKRKSSDKDSLEVHKLKTSPTIKICKEQIGDNESLSE